MRNAIIGSFLSINSNVTSGGGGGSFVYYSTTFDGSSYLSHTGPLTGIPAGSQGTVSTWVKLNAGGDGITNYIFSINDGFTTLRKNGSGTFELTSYDVTPTKLLDIETTATYSSATGWHHIIVSWNTVAGLLHMYVDDAESVTVWTLNSGSIPYNIGDVSVGSVGSSNPLYGSLSEFYFTNTYIDITQTVNRRLFNSPSIPVNLGSNGSTPTGTQPFIYLPNPYSTFNINAGSGGNFGVTGTLTAGSGP